MNKKDPAFKEQLIKYVMAKANFHYMDDFPISEIETWIREFFEIDQTQL